MHNVKSSCWIFAVAISLVALLAVGTAHSAVASPEPLIPNERHAKVGRLVTTLFERSHYRRMPVDDVASSRMFDAYLDALDGNRQYFLAADIEQFEKWRAGLDDAVKRGRLDPVFAIYRKYVERTRERLSYALQQLDVEHDFTLDEEFVFDRVGQPWPVTEAELDDYWRQRVKNDALGLMLTGKDVDEARATLRNRYTQVLKRFEQVRSDDVFETFMNAFANSIDPHTSYYSPRNSEEYRIQMSLNYDGIGATLQLQDEYVSVINVIEGGPAATDGTLKPKDRIIGVGQGETGPIVDVVGRRLDEVVELIRGPSGSTLRLQVLPGGAAPGSPPVVIPLVRDKVKLEAQAARKELLEIDQEGETRRIGIITVPSFYQDYNARASGAREYTSTTADVRRLAIELIADGIDGMILDLRNNGGGHLSEATSLANLFLPGGPVVQLRDTSGRIEVLSEQSVDPVYDGPLAVLVNRFSASASEIVAGAIQDYGRGIIIGQQTYGKGTVQNLYPLDRYAPANESRFGQLTLTVGMYYRVTGESTQHRGVIPDVAVPSPIDAQLVGESTRERALPWDQIRPTPFSRQDILAEAIEVISAGHLQRREDDPDFQYLVDHIEEIEAQRNRKSVSLNLETRRAENQTQEQRLIARENARRAALGLEPVVTLSQAEPEDKPDALLHEAARMVADLSKLPGTLLAKRSAQGAR